MVETPDDLARLLHETLEAVGWDAEASELAQKVQRLDIGLPMEDEFSVVCAWLGHCELIHKLDQHQMPRMSSDTFQVPDLLARFTTQTDDRPVLIEVKRKSGNTLSFQPGYLQRLQNYADLMGMPLLIAWKFHSMWMLFEVKHLKKAKKNYNIRFDTAMRENLLGVLAGDFAYRIGTGAGVHFRCDKEELVSIEETDEGELHTWQLRIGKVAFTDRNGKAMEAPSSETQTLLAIWDLQEAKEEHPDFIHVSYTAPEEGMQFAHSSLVRLLDWSTPRDERMSWRRVSRKDQFTTIEDFRGAVIKAMEEKVVHIVLDVQPQTIPDYVPDRAT